ncbi:hypothetical protein PCL_06022 [Purpureocillium lilacinum]|uniref:Uncharacterized protein n=1 Tax=Purpureocillium lilacinum TaxID=33203 RepID=A0A2U3ELI0_PURLI|nr:hypothetical protein PCL_06022 [Purpureocillium lilacinum]
MPASSIEEKKEGESVSRSGPMVVMPRRELSTAKDDESYAQAIGSRVVAQEEPSPRFGSGDVGKKLCVGEEGGDQRRGVEEQEGKLDEEAKEVTRYRPGSGLDDRGRAAGAAVVNIISGLLLEACAVGRRETRGHCRRRAAEGRLTTQSRAGGTSRHRPLERLIRTPGNACRDESDCCNAAAGGPLDGVLMASIGRRRCKSEPWTHGWSAAQLCDLAATGQAAPKASKGRSKGRRQRRRRRRRRDGGGATGTSQAGTRTGPRSAGEVERGVGPAEMVAQRRIGSGRANLQPGSLRAAWPTRTDQDGRDPSTATNKASPGYLGRWACRLTWPRNPPAAEEWSNRGVQPGRLQWLEPAGHHIAALRFIHRRSKSVTWVARGLHGVFPWSFWFWVSPGGHARHDTVELKRSPRLACKLPVPTASNLLRDAVLDCRSATWTPRAWDEEDRRVGSLRRPGFSLGPSSPFLQGSRSLVDRPPRSSRAPASRGLAGLSELPPGSAKSSASRLQVIFGCSPTPQALWQPALRFMSAACGNWTGGSGTAPTLTKPTNKSRGGLGRRRRLTELMPPVSVSKEIKWVRATTRLAGHSRATATSLDQTKQIRRVVGQVDSSRGGHVGRRWAFRSQPPRGTHSFAIGKPGLQASPLLRGDEASFAMA